MEITENDHNTGVVYLLSGIDRHIYLFELFQVCLKIYMKHLENIDVEMFWLVPVTSQCIKSLFPTTQRGMQFQQCWQNGPHFAWGSFELIFFCEKYCIYI